MTSEVLSRMFKWNFKKTILERRCSGSRMLKNFKKTVGNNIVKGNVQYSVEDCSSQFLDFYNKNRARYHISRLG
jgi:hypothetical protein